MKKQDDDSDRFNIMPRQASLFGGVAAVLGGLGALVAALGRSSPDLAAVMNVIELAAKLVGGLVVLWIVGRHLDNSRREQRDGFQRLDTAIQEQTSAIVRLLEQMAEARGRESTNGANGCDLTPVGARARMPSVRDPRER